MGTPEGPFSVGGVGDWTIAGPTIAAVHAYLYFDGAMLFVSSAIPDDPARLAGVPVSNEWTQLNPPCELNIGGAKLVLEAAPFDPETTFQLSGANRLPVPQGFASRPASGPLGLPSAVPLDEIREETIVLPESEIANRSGANPVGRYGAPPKLPEMEQEESTRLLPIEEMRNSLENKYGSPPPAAGRSAIPPVLGTGPKSKNLPNSSVLGPRRSLGASANFQPPSIQPPSDPHSQLPSAIPSSGPAVPSTNQAQPTDIAGKIKLFWQEAETPIKALIFLVPVSLFLFMLIIIWGATR
jgi:hypothetical protein